VVRMSHGAPMGESDQGNRRTVDRDNRWDGRALTFRRVPVASSLPRLVRGRRLSRCGSTRIERVVTKAESRERRGQADDTDRSRPGTGAASWQPPRAQAGCRDCGTHGNSRSPAPRSPRTSGDGPTERRATDSFPTTAPRSCRGLEAEPVQHLLHRDLPANGLEVDTGPGCSSRADGVVGCSRTVPFPFISRGGTGTIPLT
jgi:hypothetical protein